MVPLPILVQPRRKNSPSAGQNSNIIFTKRGHFAGGGTPKSAGGTFPAGWDLKKKIVLSADKNSNIIFTKRGHFAGGGGTKIGEGTFPAGSDPKLIKFGAPSAEKVSSPPMVTPADFGHPLADFGALHAEINPPLRWSKFKYNFHKKRGEGALCSRGRGVPKSAGGALLWRGGIQNKNSEPPPPTPARP